MNDLIKVQKLIAPQMLDTMKKRYLILKEISLKEPVGRRNLSISLSFSERTIRSEIDFLKSQGNKTAYKNL